MIVFTVSGNVMATQEFKPNNSNTGTDSKAASDFIRARTTGVSATRFADSFVSASKRKKFRHDPNAIRRGEVEHQRYEREVLSSYSEDEVSRRERLSGFMFKPYLFVFLVAVFIMSLPFWLR